MNATNNNTNNNMNNNTNKKRKYIKRIVLGIILAIIISFAAFLIYTSIYYHANDDAKTYINRTSSSVSVEKVEKNEYVFLPSDMSNVTTGFIFYPGGKVEYTAYAPLMTKLAEKGIACYLLEMPYNLAVLDSDAAEKVINNNPNIKNWYIGGHSLGGAVASIYISQNYSKYNGLVLLGAYSTKDLSQTNLKALSIYGENDGVMNREKYSDCLKNMPADFTEYIISGGCHAYFGSYGEQKGDGKAAITAEEQQSITVDRIANWMFDIK